MHLPPERYALDYEWMWDRRRETDVATLRVVAHHQDPRIARAAILTFLNGLPTDDNGVRGRGGWAAYPVANRENALDLVSGGQDVADGIESAADDAFEALSAWPGLTLTWQQLRAGDEPWNDAGMA
ncbi:MAG: hypothetical protein E7Z96_10410 [Actinomycetaceae bacterium]|nr:hypothetical protein [Actinomycetaceae bacterium]